MYKWNSLNNTSIYNLKELRREDQSISAVGSGEKALRHGQLCACITLRLDGSSGISSSIGQ